MDPQLIDPTRHSTYEYYETSGSEKKNTKKLQKIKSNV
jgi:hypothetical protein